jgi:hypothetical protein
LVRKVKIYNPDCQNEYNRSTEYSLFHLLLSASWCAF